MIALYVINGSRPHLLETERSDEFFFFCICVQVCYVLDRCRGGETHKQVRYSLVVVIIMEIQYYFCFCFIIMSLCSCVGFSTAARARTHRRSTCLFRMYLHVVRMFFAVVG